MERITGSEALGLFEAYNAVYAPQELTEEQVWEEVESWVNSLIEEGYDLSEYTWEEMYEAYIVEAPYGARERTPVDIGALFQAGLKRYGPGAMSPTAAATPAPKPTKDKPVSNIPTATSKSPYTQKNLSGDQFKAYKAAGGDAEFAKGTGTASQLIARGRKALAGSSDAKPSVPSVNTKPSVPPAKPVTPSKVTPSSPGPAIGTTKGGTKFERRAATSAELKAARAAGGGEAGIKAAVTRSQPTQGPSAAKVDPGSVARSMQAFKPVTPTAAAKAAPSTSPAASGSVVPASNAIAAKPSSAMSQSAIRNRRLNMEMEYDAYDLVLEYLLTEGHADTVEEAHYVMMEMDAEVIQDIVEQTTK